MYNVVKTNNVIYIVFNLEPNNLSLEIGFSVFKLVSKLRCDHGRYFSKYHKMVPFIFEDPFNICQF